MFEKYLQLPYHMLPTPVPIKAPTSHCSCFG